MNHFEQRRDEWLLSTDKTKLDIAAIHDFLSNRSYWARGRSREVMEHAIQNSLCFGIYEQDRQAAFARVVTDYATFAWVCDVFVLENYRRQGLSKWLVQGIVAHPDLQGLRRILLATKDAHELYQRYGGFELIDNPNDWLAKLTPLLK